MNQRHDFDGADSCFRKALKINPESVEANSGIAMILREKCARLLEAQFRFIFRSERNALRGVSRRRSVARKRRI